MSPTENAAAMDAISSTRSSSEATREQLTIEPGDLEKVMSKHEDADVAVTIQESADPNVVNWDGPDDPEKPLNWPASKKWINIALISSITFLTPFASSTFAPGVPLVMDEFHEKSVALASLVVSIYVLGYVFGPLIIAPASEHYGRLPVYHVNTFLFLVFTIGCARSTSISMLIAFRFLAGVAGSSPITVGSGTIADTFKQEQRGKVMSIWSFPILFGPRTHMSSAWMKELIKAVDGDGTFIFWLSLETYPPVLLERKAKRLRKETGNAKLRSALQSPKTPRELFLLSIVRPLKMLCFSPIVFGVSLYIAVTYGYLYLLFTTVTFVFEDQYNISSSNVGLVYLGIGLGQLTGLSIFGYYSDKLLRKWAKGGELKPELRLPLLWPGAFLIPTGLFIYGWSAEYKVHWIVPLIGTFIFGAGMIITFMPIGTYLVDAYTSYAASAMAANTVLRSIGGALLPLAGRSMYQSLGLGWGNSLLAFIALGMTPMIWVFCKYGEKIRHHPRFKLNL
ncbi:hypothetical protein LTR07_006023 [Exophiala xenobiotica]|uniref:Cercosporin MFS transporter CTB4 n=1 Tax=Vermiconidia calcicola TaxID=1690605 RepID=A0AAV9Q6D3_9PEZI|nr:hypothetical protein LTR98_003080 [Exophiala xenobiotica]KAK5440926.1 hypothetical protein LTR18_007530 [Exophiala xenobiotica]KAK5519053.1 hypothetical protein LTR07_006023 [Exophiala xenobiotica]KAK5534076.1 hypothetical protein LTR25_007056 [Vermiconidia calcicola]